jgi:hypothetical protein
MHFNSGRSGDALRADARAAHHARMAGDTALEMWNITSEAGYAGYGPTQSMRLSRYAMAFLSV